MRDTRNRQIINRQAWEDVGPAVRDLFRTRQRELLEEADQTRRDAPQRRSPARRRTQRARDFGEFVRGLLDSGALDSADDDTLDLVEAFLAKPTAGNKLRLLTHLQNRSELLGDRAGDLARFA